MKEEVKKHKEDVSSERNLPNEEVVAKVVEAITTAEDFLILTLKTDEEEPEKTAASFAISGNGAKLIETLLDSLDEHPKLGMLFKLIMMKKMIGEREEGSRIINPFGGGIRPPFR